MTDQTINLPGVAMCAEFLGTLFVADPADEAAGPVFAEIAQLRSMESWPFGNRERLDGALDLMREGIAASGLHEEYLRLFVGPASLEAPPWGSVYLDRDGIVFGESTLELRGWMRDNGMAMSQKEREPDDHIGRMLLLLAWLVEGKPELVGEFLQDHLLTWAPRYFELLQKHARNDFYQGLGALAAETLASIARECAARPKRVHLLR